MKNPLGLNQAEIIAALSLELVKNSKRVINPVTKQPFRVKFGRDNDFLPSFVHRWIKLRFSFRSSSRWNCWRKKFSILFVRRYDQYGRMNCSTMKMDFSCLLFQASRITTTGEVDRMIIQRDFYFLSSSARTNPFKRYILCAFERFSVLRS